MNRVTLQNVEREPRPAAIEVDRPQFVVGRDPECDYMVANPFVSRRHCQIELHDDGVYVRDLSSRNGTGINGNVVADLEPLADGDHLWLGTLPLLVRIEPVPDTEASAVELDRVVPSVPVPPVLRGPHDPLQWQEGELR